jgi:hypothetical protein
MCRVTEAFSDPYYLGWFESDPDGKESEAGFDIHEVRLYNGVDHLVVIGGHTVDRDSPNDPWLTTQVEDYFNDDGSPGYPMFPVMLNDGDAGEITTSGTWKWTKYDTNNIISGTDHGPVIATGKGTWKYTSRYNYSFGRLIWEEIEEEKHNDTGAVVHYHRIHQYDANGWMGFIDCLDPKASAFRADWLQIAKGIGA